MRIQTTGDVGDASYDGEEDFSFIGVDTAREYFKDTPDALKNVQKIVKVFAFQL